MFPPLPILLTAAAGFCCGLLWHFSSPSAALTQQRSETIPSTPPTTTRTSSGSLPDVTSVSSTEELAALTLQALNGRKDNDDLQDLLDQWIATNAEGGLDFLLAQPRASTVVWQYMGRWSRKDPAAAVARTLLFEDQQDKNVAMSRISHTLSVDRPEDFFLHLSDLRKGHAADYCMEDAARRLAGKSPEAMRRIFLSAEGENASSKARAAMLTGLAAGWASKDPEAAIGFIGSQGGDEQQREAALRAVALQILPTRPELAAEALQGTSTSCITAAARELAETDPARAMTWLQKYFPEHPPSEAAAIASSNMPREAGAAVEYLARNADLVFHTSVGYQAYRESGVDDARKALSLAQQIADPAVRERVQRLFLHQLAVNAPEEAIQSASIVPPAYRENVIGIAVTNWAQEDPYSASAWVAAQPEGQERDPAIRGLIEPLLSEDPLSALHWAAALSNSDERFNILRTTVQTLQKQGVATTPLLDQLELAPAERTRLEQDLNSPVTR